MLPKRTRLELQRANLASLVRSGEFKFTSTWFPYTSGEIGPYYIQSLGVTNEGADYGLAIDSMARIILEDLAEWGISVDAISGGESRDWDFSNPTAVALGLPHAKLYEKRPPAGAQINGRTFAHVADLNNEGSSMRDKWVPMIDQYGGRMACAFFFVDRREKGVQVMRDLGIPNDSVVPMDANSWQALKDLGHVSDSLYRSLMERSEDPETWARNALRRHPEVLIGLLSGKDPKDKEKGEKILVKGYPDMRAELTELMKERGFDYTGGRNGAN